MHAVSTSRRHFVRDKRQTLCGLTVVPFGDHLWERRSAAVVNVALATLQQCGACTAKAERTDPWYAPLHR